MNKLLIVLFWLVLIFTACEKKEERIVPKISIADQVDVAVETMLDREAFVSQMQNELDEIGVKLEALKKKDLGSNEKSGGSLSPKVSALEQEQIEAEAKLVALKAVIGERWKDLKSGVASAIKHFRQSVENAG